MNSREKKENVLISPWLDKFFNVLLMFLVLLHCG